MTALESVTAALRWGIAHSRIFVPRTAYCGDKFPSRPPLPNSLAGLRTSVVAELIREVAPRSVIDFGCWHGWLLAELAGDARFERLTGVDFDLDSLTDARRRIGSNGQGSGKKVDLRQGLPGGLQYETLFDDTGDRGRDS